MFLIIRGKISTALLTDTVNTVSIDSSSDTINLLSKTMTSRRRQSSSKQTYIYQIKMNILVMIQMYTRLGSLEGTTTECLN